MLLTQMPFIHLSSGVEWAAAKEVRLGRSDIERESCGDKENLNIKEALPNILHAQKLLFGS